ncbi:MAG: 33 kDa chaperonin [Catillopecten margaritatus gill symbiont]|uniref:33 kDa chaperonin n=1 Tax=Catillopecten margaritatus gill symbiont TaxID=3083288 RepID=A0AAU6PIC7_9GAMM
MNIHRRFLFKELDIRGQHLSISDAWQAMIKNRGYSEQVRQLFGEMNALAIMLASDMKHKGKFTLQSQGDGLVSLLLVEVTHDLKIRGMVRSNSDISVNNTLDEILGKGQIVATLYNAQTDASFQSLVPRNTEGLLQTFEDYFTQSEQLESKLWVSSSKNNLSAMLIQKMPVSADNDPEDWHRIKILADTVTNEEMCELGAETLLHRLFHEETIELFGKTEVYYECQKDRKRFEKVVFNLGEEEARKLLDERGEIAIHNEICNEHLFFNKKDIDRIFKD